MRNLGNIGISADVEGSLVSLASATVKSALPPVSKETVNDDKKKVLKVKETAEAVFCATLEFQK